MMGSVGQQRRVIAEREPDLVRQGDDPPRDQFQVTLDFGLVPADAKPECIFEDDGQQTGGGLGAEYRPGEACRQQVGYAPDMVNVYVGSHQCPDTIQRKLDV